MMGEVRGVLTVKKCVSRPQVAVCGVMLVGCVATAVGRVRWEREMKNMVEILVNLVAGLCGYATDFRTEFIVL
jgi:hypothetical protein